MPQSSHVFPAAGSAYALRRFDHAVRLAVGTEHSRRHITRGGNITRVHGHGRAWSMEHGAHTSVERIRRVSHVRGRQICNVGRFDTSPYLERSLRVHPHEKGLLTLDAAVLFAVMICGCGLLLLCLHVQHNETSNLCSCSQFKSQKSPNPLAVERLGGLQQQQAQKSPTSCAEQAPSPKHAGGGTG